MNALTVCFGKWGGPYDRTVECPTRIKLTKWQELGLQYTASGYGNKIPTSKQLLYNNRWRRVYCTIYSNIGTCWVVIDGNKCVVR